MNNNNNTNNNNSNNNNNNDNNKNKNDNNDSKTNKTRHHTDTPPYLIITARCIYREIYYDRKLGEDKIMYVYNESVYIYVYVYTYIHTHMSKRLRCAPIRERRIPFSRTRFDISFFNARKRIEIFGE